jgi:TonB family protein
MKSGMPSKKVLIFAVALSLISHALLISATGIISIRLGNQKKETTITVSLEQAEKSQKGENTKEDYVKTQDASLPAEVTAGDNPEEATVLLDRQDEIYAPYLTKIKKKIEDVWFYPKRAFDEKKEGISTVKFSLNKSGKLVASGIVESSGYESLDRAAVTSIQAAAPYEPFPKNINLSRINIIATFRYSFI